jgi:REP element-mobilizing transposase RayT
MQKYRNTYRIASARLSGWDYRNVGAYFITICTHNREHYFGECKQGKMKLSIAGMIAQGCWYQIPFLNPHVSLGAFVVMPNHIHGILILDEMENDGRDVGRDVGRGGVETFDSNVSNVNLSNVNTSNKSSNVNHDLKPNDITNSDGVLVNNDHKNLFYQNISPKSGSVSRIIQQYKTVCTKHIRLACPEIGFEWQTRFHDHIIRNDMSFKKISDYIKSNPKNWKDDKFHNSKL